jgi:hypothetical protein
MLCVGFFLLLELVKHADSRGASATFVARLPSVHWRGGDAAKIKRVALREQLTAQTSLVPPFNESAVLMQLKVYADAHTWLFG